MNSEGWSVWVFSSCGHLTQTSHDQYPGHRCPVCNNFGAKPERMLVVADQPPTFYGYDDSVQTPGMGS